MGERIGLSDEEWGVIGLLLPSEQARVCRPAGGNRSFFEGMMWMARTGSPWRHLPGEWEMEQRLPLLSALGRDGRVRPHARNFDEKIAFHGVQAVVPAKRGGRNPAPQGCDKCPHRSRVEQLFNKLKNWRRITRATTNQRVLSRLRQHRISSALAVLSTKPSSIIILSTDAGPSSGCTIKGKMLSSRTEKSRNR